jgi:hypothetical protein
MGSTVQCTRVWGWGSEVAVREASRGKGRVSGFRISLLGLAGGKSHRFAPFAPAPAHLVQVQNQGDPVVPLILRGEADLTRDAHSLVRGQVLYEEVGVELLQVVLLFFLLVLLLHLHLLDLLLRGELLLEGKLFLRAALYILLSLCLGAPLRLISKIVEHRGEELSAPAVAAALTVLLLIPIVFYPEPAHCRGRVHGAVDLGKLGCPRGGRDSGRVHNVLLGPFDGGNGRIGSLQEVTKRKGEGRD